MYTLRDYQKIAVEQSLECIEAAGRDYNENSQLSAIVLSAPTGAGKTVMSGDVIDKLLSKDAAGNSKYVVLWITDNPSLNRQSANRIKSSTSGEFPVTVLSGAGILESGDRFDKAVFELGTLYMLNTQAASENAGMSVKERGPNNVPTGRSFTIWDTIRNTVREHGAKFIVMIDEAHRGVEKEGEASTIIGRIINDVPIVYGISATEKRFVDWMDRKRRVMPISVSITDVRKAGIIKSNLIVSDTVDGKEEHVTLIKDAVRQTIEFEKNWAKYCADEGIETIYPLMVIQVEDSGSDPETQSIFDYDIDLYIKGVLQEWSTLTDENIVHTFSERKDLEVKGLSGGKRTVKYMQPDLIDSDTNVRVVLAKTAISTGWDCPRAEVLVSFRSASDETYITQLIGRMIRQPLGKQIESDESLNSTYCTLPNFDQDAVRNITKRLRDDEGMALDVVNISPFTYRRNPLIHKEVFDALLKVPTYDVPEGASASQVSLLRRFAVALSRDGINVDAPEQVKRHICKFLDDIPENRSIVYRKAMEGVAEEEKALAVAGGDKVITLSRASIEMTDDSESVEVGDLLIKKDVIDLERSFLKDSVLPEDIRNIYQIHLVTNGKTVLEANRRIRAYNFGRLKTWPNLNESADLLMASWAQEYGEAIESLMSEPDDRYAIYREVTGKHNEPFSTFLPVVPKVIQENIGSDLIKAGRKATSTDNATIIRRWVKDEDRYRHNNHLFSSEDIDGRYIADISGIRKQALKNETEAFTCTGWYNNPSHGKRSITIPWVDANDEWNAIRPDFVVFHEVERETVPSLVIVLSGDAMSALLKKIKWCLWYAEKHHSYFHSLPLVIGAGGGSKALRVDLTEQKVRVELGRELSTETPQIEMFFTEYGELYGR